jgi:hypothetical protein
MTSMRGRPSLGVHRGSVRGSDYQMMEIDPLHIQGGQRVEMGLNKYKIGVG